VDRSPTLLAALTRVDPATRDEIMEACQARLAEYVRPDGTVAIPAAAHVAVAGA